MTKRFTLQLGTRTITISDTHFASVLAAILGVLAVLALTKG